MKISCNVFLKRCKIAFICYSPPFCTTASLLPAGEGEREITGVTESVGTGVLETDGRLVGVGCTFLVVVWVLPVNVLALLIARAVQEKEISVVAVLLSGILKPWVLRSVITNETLSDRTAGIVEICGVGESASRVIVATTTGVCAYSLSNVI